MLVVLGVGGSVRLRVAATAVAMLDPWRLLVLLMAFVLGAGGIRSGRPSMRYGYLNSMRSGWWCCIPFGLFRVGGFRSQDGGALLLLLHRCGRRRWSFIEFMCVDLSFGVLSLAAHPWVGASSSVGNKSSLSVFGALCFLPPAAAEGFRAAGDGGGEEEQEIPHVDLVVISYCCRRLFVSFGM